MSGGAGLDHARLAMAIGEAMFSQRSIRRFRPDRIPTEDLQLILEAAARAPNGGNRQPARFLLLTDPATIRAFGALYHEAWWAKRRDERGWTGPQDVPAEETNYRSAMRLADDIKDAPCVVLAMAIRGGGANSVIPAVQNLMLAAQARGLATCPQVSFVRYQSVIATQLSLAATERVVCGMSLGYPEQDAGLNRMQMPREPVATWLQWH